ncbi:MAG: hypothetical protein ACOC7P_01760 [Chloroflexota bacterium]
MADEPDTSLNKLEELMGKMGIDAELLQARLAKSQNTKKFERRTAINGHD